MKVQGTGEYKTTEGEMIGYNYEYEEFGSVEEALEALGNDKALHKINRMHKLDAANPARESAKVANGHSTRKVMSAEEKEAGKAKRRDDKVLLDSLKNPENSELLAEIMAKINA